MTAVFNFLMIAGAIQGFIFNIATFLSSKKIERPILFLNLLVFFISMNNLQSWFIEKEFLSSYIPFHDFTIPWYVLIAPMFYAFLVHYLEIEEKRFSFIKVSFLIFFIELLARTIVAYQVKSGFWPDFYLANYTNVEDLVTFSFSLFLFYKGIQIVFFKYNLYKRILSYDDLRWLKWFFYLGGGVFVLWLVSIIFNSTGWVQKPYSYYPLRLGSSLLIYWIGYQGFFRYVVLKDRILLRKEIRKTSDQANLKPNNSDERRELAFSEVDAYILENQKFLDPQLSLESLSEELGKSTSHLSKLMNAHAGSNFPDHINKYRVEEAKKLLANDDFDTYTIVAIGLECGFNSKSTFYTAFKKFTGQTPNQYRKRSF
jgi:AraC-like DNA-binding protein